MHKHKYSPVFVAGIVIAFGCDEVEAFPLLLSLVNTGVVQEDALLLLLLEEEEHVVLCGVAILV